MIEITFTYEGSKYNIQSNLTDKMKDIFKNFRTIVHLEENALFYLYHGSAIDEELELERLISDDDKQLNKMDKYTKALIMGWIERNLVDCDNPRRYGKSLTGNKSGQWRYRIGDYRIICEIQDKKIAILVLEAGHRKNIYL